MVAPLEVVAALEVLVPPEVVALPRNMPQLRGFRLAMALVANAFPPDPPPFLPCTCEKTKMLSKE